MKRCTWANVGWGVQKRPSPLSEAGWQCRLSRASLHACFALSKQSMWFTPCSLHAVKWNLTWWAPCRCLRGNSWVGKRVVCHGTRFFGWACHGQDSKNASQGGTNCIEGSWSAIWTPLGHQFELCKIQNWQWDCQRTQFRWNEVINQFFVHRQNDKMQTLSVLEALTKCRKFLFETWHLKIRFGREHLLSPWLVQINLSLIAKMELAVHGMHDLAHCCLLWIAFENFLKFCMDCVELNAPSFIAIEQTCAEKSMAPLECLLKQRKAKVCETTWSASFWPTQWPFWARSVSQDQFGKSAHCKCTKLFWLASSGLQFSCMPLQPADSASLQRCFCWLTLAGSHLHQPSRFAHCKFTMLFWLAGFVF